MNHATKLKNVKELFQLKLSQGCKPITKPGECCPSDWDCSSWSARMEKKDQCWYNGQYYNQGDMIDDVKQSCTRGCYCHVNSAGKSGLLLQLIQKHVMLGNAVIECAHVDCYHPHHLDWDNCRARYSNLDDCCSDQFTCGQELEDLPTCKLDNKTYHAGERMYPKVYQKHEIYLLQSLSQADSCVTCLCGEGWDGDMSGVHCSRTQCDLTLAGDHMLRGCTPVFKEGVCCAVDWVCPDNLKVAKY